MAKLFGRWGAYEPRTPAEKAKARRQEKTRREAKANAAAWLEKTRWCTNGCGKEAARYDDSPGHTLRYSGACSPECEEAVELRKTQNPQVQRPVGSAATPG